MGRRKLFDFDRWTGVIDEDNHADDYYNEGEEKQVCDLCGNLMVPLGYRKYKCPVCGNIQEYDEDGHEAMS